MSFYIKEIEDSDRPGIKAIIQREWGIPVVVRGNVYYPQNLPGFTAMEGEEIAGLITCNIRDGQCEIVTLNSFKPNRGIGTGLVRAVQKKAVAAGCKRYWLITTNDNVDAIRFYQMKGFRLAAVHIGAIEESRRVKPEIPDTGYYGIPIRDEVELEMILG